MMLVTCALPPPGKPGVAQHDCPKLWQLHVILIDAHGFAVISCRRSVLHQGAARC